MQTCLQLQPCSLVAARSSSEGSSRRPTRSLRRSRRRWTRFLAPTRAQWRIRRLPRRLPVTKRSALPSTRQALHAECGALVARGTALRTCPSTPRRRSTFAATPMPPQARCARSPCHGP
eukprot:Amastigsp_a677400_7.p4 type:complete len:119 gc:universal Amastigsp_a677400_7:440-796(+)